MQRLFVALTGVVLSAVVLAACGGGDGAQTTPPTPTPIRTAFPTRPPAQLTICVDTVEATKSFQAEAVDRIRSAMVEVLNHPVYPRAYPSYTEPLIDAGCPAPPALYDQAALLIRTPRSLMDVKGRTVGTSGYYAEAVFVIENDEIEQYTKEYEWRLTTEELRWSGDVGFPTTYGLYLSPADLNDMAFLADALEKRIGLEDVTDPIEPGYHPSADQ